MPKLNDGIPAVIEILSSHRAVLGEGPIWDWRIGRLLWVDILGGVTCEINPASGEFPTHVRQTPLTSIGLASNGGYVGTTLRAFCLLDKALTIRTLGAEVEPELSGNRFNDGKVDPWGQFWAGTMDADIAQASGALYRFDNLNARQIDRDYGVTNGPAFSLDRRRAFHADSGKGIVFAFQLDRMGEIKSRETFITFDRGMGMPDGMTVDAAGRLYVAHFGGARISRWSADGSYDGQIPLPVSNVTSICFGGSKLDTLFATSAKIDDEANPAAGATFKIQLDAQGRQEPLFAV